MLFLTVKEQQECQLPVKLYTALFKRKSMYETDPMKSQRDIHVNIWTFTTAILAKGMPTKATPRRRLLKNVIRHG